MRACTTRQVLQVPVALRVSIGMAARVLLRAAPTVRPVSIGMEARASRRAAVIIPVRNQAVHPLGGRGIVPKIIAGQATAVHIPFPPDLQALPAPVRNRAVRLPEAHGTAPITGASCRLPPHRWTHQACNPDVRLLVAHGTAPPAACLPRIAGESHSHIFVLQITCGTAASV